MTALCLARGCKQPLKELRAAEVQLRDQELVI